MEKGADAFRTIGEVAGDLDLPQHVLRFWETRFAQIKPLKRGGGRRYYRPEDVDLLRAIRHLLYGEGYTIKGVQRIIKEHGPRAVAQMALTQMQPDAPSAAQPSAPKPSLARPRPARPVAEAAPAPPRPALAESAPAGAAPNVAPASPPALAARAAAPPLQEAFDLDSPPGVTPMIDPPAARLDIAAPRRAAPPDAARPAASLLDAARDALRPQAADPAPRPPEAVVPIVDPPRARFLAPTEPRFAPAEPRFAPALSAQDIERLKAALYELSECERILASTRVA